MKAYDLVLLFRQKKLFCVLGVAQGTPFLHKLGQKMVMFRGFSKFFLELLDSNQCYQYYTAVMAGNDTF